jgi:hypothetical protein
MLLSELKPGVYKLAKAVTNPEKDRRVKRDWTKTPTWAKDFRVIVRKNHMDNKAKAFFEIIAEGARWTHMRVTEFMPGFLPLVEAMEPVEETLDTVLTGQHGLSYAILENADREQRGPALQDQGNPRKDRVVPIRAKAS